MTSAGATAALLKVYMSQEAGSEAVEELALRKQTQMDRVWQWLTRRPMPVAGSWQHHLLRLFASSGFSVLVVFLTVVALFLVDINVLANPNRPDPADTVVAAIIFVCFLFFLLEIAGCILVQDEYFLSFFFFCDLIGTLSLIFDIPWMSKPVGLDFSSSSTAVLRASRVARTGTRATRVLRLLRTMRMPALLRCCKSRADEEDLTFVPDASELDELASDETPTNPDGSPATALPIQADKHHGKKKKKPVAAAAAPTQKIVNTNVGTKLQLVVSKRVIFLVTIMIFLIPLLTDNAINEAPDVSLAMLERTVLLDPSMFAPMTQSMLDQLGGTPLFIKVLSHTYPSAFEPDTSHIRGAALANTTSSSGLSYMVFDERKRLAASTLLSLLMTCFTVVMFAGGSVLFTEDAERLFFKPIERMIQPIKRLANILFEMDANGSDQLELDETILIEAVVARMSDIFSVRLDRDGVRRKTSLLRTTTSRWRIHVEESDIALSTAAASTTGASGSGDTPDVDRMHPDEIALIKVRSKDLLLSHEVEELASVARCLDAPLCAQYFCAFLRNEYRVESAYFLEQAKAYRMAAEKLAHQARQLYAIFISDDASNQVDIAWNARRATAQRLQLYTSHLSELFTPIEREVLAQLARDSYPRFLHSIQCLKLLKHITLQRQRAVQRGQRGLQELRVENTAAGAWNSARDGPEPLPGKGDAQISRLELEQIRASLDKQA